MLHFFPKGTTSTASSRFRAYYIAEKMESRGNQTIIYPPPSPYHLTNLSFGRLNYFINTQKIISSFKHGDVVWLQRIYAPIELLVSLTHQSKKRGFKIIFDFDDANYLHWPKAFNYMITNADLVMAGSMHLYHKAIQLNPNSHLIPTCIPLELYTPKTNYQASQINIGWIGNGPAHIENLALLKPVMKLLNSSNVKWTLIGAQKDPRIYSLFSRTKSELSIVDSLDWSKTNQVSSVINTFDIGIMPLTDTEFNRGKCAFKILEYMACGVPTVASPIGQNQHVINNHHNGILATDLDEWLQALKQLINQKPLRKKLGISGLQTVKQNYSHQVIVPKIEQIIKQLLKS